VTETILQIEGLVGPTHHYAGLGSGNLASATHANQVASPKQAALQSLEKMRWLSDQGAEVVVMPPQCRPRLDIPTRLGMTRGVQETLTELAESSPTLLRAIWSASSMWAANSATTTLTQEGHLHITPANLLGSMHRVIEAQESFNYFSQLFTKYDDVSVHPAIPVSATQADEGAANHMHLSNPHSDESVDIFVYGASPASTYFPTRFVPRHMRQASELIIQNHDLDSERCFLWQQHPDAIDAGVFHNDVIALSHRDLLVCHEKAYTKQTDKLHTLKDAAPWVKDHIITGTELPLNLAVKSYFFNAQLVTGHNDKTLIIFPQECSVIPEAKYCCDRVAELVHSIHFMDLKQSMQNGGGPACLRLRMPVLKRHVKVLSPSLRYSVRLHQQLAQIVEKYYPDTFSVEDLTSAEQAEKALECYHLLYAVLKLKPYNPV